ncbi:MAG: orotate phosphoribosyltransferase [Rhizobacter sp.]|nr:orotate phosphoribosyltransferase [Chlorobiales bacterium]
MSAALSHPLSKDDLIQIFKSTGALLEGHFKLSSGLHSPNYFQCAKVLQHPKYLEQLCSGIAEHFRGESIDAVLSPAIGGVVVGTEVGRQLGVRTLFAERADGVMSLRRGFEIAAGERVLFIEDVVTTGGSVREVMKLATERGAFVAGVGFIVDRSNGKVRLAENQFSLLQLDVVTYQLDVCPLCAADVPLVKPGSRPSPLASSSSAVPTTQQGTPGV